MDLDWLVFSGLVSFVGYWIGWFFQDWFLSLDLDLLVFSGSVSFVGLGFVCFFRIGFFR
jgi:hypothetical protein